MGFKKIVNVYVFLHKSTNIEHFVKGIIGHQIIYKPGSVIEDVISLGLSSHLSSSG